MITTPTLAGLLRWADNTDKAADVGQLAELGLVHSHNPYGINPMRITPKGSALVRLLLRTAQQAAGLSAEQLDRVAVKSAAAMQRSAADYAKLVPTPTTANAFEIQRLQSDIRAVEGELNRRRKQRSAELVKLEEALTEKRDRLARLTATKGEE